MPSGSRADSEAAAWSGGGRFRGIRADERCMPRRAARLPFRVALFSCIERLRACLAVVVVMLSHEHYVVEVARPLEEGAM